MPSAPGKLSMVIERNKYLWKCYTKKKKRKTKTTSVIFSLRWAKHSGKFRRLYSRGRGGSGSRNFTSVYSPPRDSNLERKIIIKRQARINKCIAQWEKEKNSAFYIFLVELMLKENEVPEEEEVMIIITINKRNAKYKVSVEGLKGTHGRGRYKK